MTGVLAEELGSAFNAEAQSAWKSGLAALVAGVSKTLKSVIIQHTSFFFLFKLKKKNEALTKKVLSFEFKIITST